MAGTLTLIRAGYGVALLCAPGALIRLTAGPGAAAGHLRRPAEADAQREAAPGSRARLVARVLGVRHLAQAALTAAGQRADPGSPVPLGGGAAVDLLHAASMPTPRRPPSPPCPPRGARRHRPAHPAAPLPRGRPPAELDG